MVEKEYKLSTSNEKAIEKVIFDENLHYLHMVFNKGEDCRSTYPIQTCI